MPRIYVHYANLKMHAYVTCHQRQDTFTLFTCTIYFANKCHFQVEFILSFCLLQKGTS